MSNPSIGIYEKALPDLPDWPSRLAAAAEAGYDFVEIPVDETEEKLARLDWTTTERAALRSAVTDTGVDIDTVILSAHRKFPLGSASVETREKALDLFKKAVDLAVDLNASTIQLAGYFVYYEKLTEEPKKVMRGICKFLGIKFKKLFVYPHTLIKEALEKLGNQSNELLLVVET